jgi:hypothetical protein
MGAHGRGLPAGRGSTVKSVESMKRLITVAGVALLWMLATAAGSADEKICELSFVVVRGFNGKPVRNASVVLHPVDKNGKQKRAGMQLKTDSDGKASYPAVPYGKLRVQVLAPNLQTFGEDYDIQEPAREIVIKLKRPQEQHSIYK